jgi:aminoglycoside phosphotransferase
LQGERNIIDCPIDRRSIGRIAPVMGVSDSQMVNAKQGVTHGDAEI